MQDPMTGQVIVKEFTLSNILNDTSEVIDWIPYDSVIAVKVVNSSNEDLSILNGGIMVTAFMNNKDTTVAGWSEVGFGLYYFVHIPHNQWEPPAATVDVKLPGHQNYTNHLCVILMSN